MNEYKGFNKLFVVLAFAFTCAAIRSVYGASAVISPKKTFTLAYTTTVTTVTPVGSSNVATTAQYQPGAVYSIIQGTSASAGSGVEFFQIYDSSFTQNAGGTAITCGALASLPLGVIPLTPHMVFTSTFNVVTRFDPPLAFENGLVVCNSAATTAATISYELGRGLNGQ